MRRLAVLSTTLVIAVAAMLSADDTARAGPPYAFTLTFSPAELQCDGDSTKLTLTLEDFNGNPVIGVPITVKFGGTIKIPGQPETHSVANGITNNQGVFQARLTPTPGTVNYADVQVLAHNGLFFFPPGLYSPACPFGVAGGPSVTGVLWLDDNANGTIDVGERTLAHEALYASSRSPNSPHDAGIPVHTAYTDSDGHFSWSDLPRSDWLICVGDQRLHVVTASVNGVSQQPLPSSALCVWARLMSGANTVAIGVQR